MVIECESVPELTFDLRIVVKDRHGVGSVSSVSLEEGVFGNVVLRSVEHQRVGGRGEFVGSAISVVEESLHAGDIHVVLGSKLVSGVRIEESLGRSGSGEEGSGHFGVRVSTEVPARLDEIG